jgi:D-amino peptidase
MKLYLSADMEGTAGIATWAQVDPANSTDYPRSQILMSREVRAAIDGAREAGATDVLVNDSHARMRNLLWDELPPDIRMIVGNRKPFSMAQGACGYDAAFFTGYHAANGTADGVLDHTYTSETLYAVRVNGKPCSEAMLNAALLGVDGVPVVLITGDRATIEQTQREMPWITGVIVKDGIGRYATDTLSPAAACEKIRAGAAAAMRALGSAKPYLFASPIVLELDFLSTHNADFAELIPSVERIGARTVRYTHDDYRTVFRAFLAAMRLGAAANAEP